MSEWTRQGIATRKEVVEVRRELGVALRRLEIDDDHTFHLELAVEELLANVVEHGYDEPGPFTVAVQRTRLNVIIEIRDHGRAFDPVADAPYDTAGAERIGGLGLMMVDKFVDRVEYARVEGENRTRLVHRLADESD